MENQQQPATPYVKVKPKIRVPHSSDALILGIGAVPGCFFVFGLIAGIIAIVQGNKAIKIYEANPDLYTASSYEEAKAGRICGIVGTVLGALSTVGWIIFLIIALITRNSVTSTFGQGF